MATLRPHTKQYPEDRRKRLGVAVARAREAAGHAYRPALAEAAKVSLRSIVKLEQGDPVGPSIYEAVARVLPQWTVDTPRAILEGETPPPIEGSSPQPGASAEEVTAGYGLPPSLQTLMSEYTYFQERLSDNKDDWPRLLRLLDMYHQLQLRETSPRGETGSAAHS